MGRVKICIYDEAGDDVVECGAFTKYKYINAEYIFTYVSVLKNGCIAGEGC